MTDNCVDIAQNQNASTKMTPRTRWSFCFGGIGRDMAYNLFSSQLLTYILLTKNVSTEMVATIGIIMIVCRIWDAFNDPIMGVIIERTNSRFGKFKPWILIGVLSNSVILILLYTSNLQGWSYIIFFTFMYLLWDITFTMNDIGYWSMLPSLTSDRADRDFTASWANLLAGLGGGIAGAGIPMFTAGKFAIGGNAITAYAAVSGIVCAMFIGCQLLTFFGVKERALPPLKQEKAGLKKLFEVIKTNDQLRWAACVMLFHNTGSGLLGALMTMYVYLQFGYEGFLVTIFTIVFGIMGGLPMMTYSFMTKKMSRKQMIYLCMGMIVVGYIAFFFAGFLNNFYFLAIWGVLISFGQSLFYNIQTIAISNTVEYNEWKTGERNEGIIFSLRPLMAKFGSALQLGIVTLVYIILRINSITNQISEAENAVNMGIMTADQKVTTIQNVLASIPANTVTYMRIFMVVIPVILVIAAMLIYLKKFTIDEAKYELMVNDLEQRLAQAQATDEADKQEAAELSDCVDSCSVDDAETIAADDATTDTDDAETDLANDDELDPYQEGVEIPLAQPDDTEV